MRLPILCAAGSAFGIILVASSAMAQPGQAVDQPADAEGSFLTPAEIALIERKCGGHGLSGKGDSITMSDGVLICSNGRRVDDPEVRAMLAVASPRIDRKVDEIMSSAGVRDALRTLENGTVERALRALKDLGNRAN